MPSLSRGDLRPPGPRQGLAPAPSPARGWAGSTFRGRGGGDGEPSLGLPRLPGSPERGRCVPITTVGPGRPGSLPPVGSGWCQVRFVELEFSSSDHLPPRSWQGAPRKPLCLRRSHPGWQPLHLAPQACTFSRVTSETTAAHPWRQQNF